MASFDYPYHRTGYIYPPSDFLQQFAVENTRLGTGPALYVCVISYECMHQLILHISGFHTPNRANELLYVARGLRADSLTVYVPWHTRGPIDPTHGPRELGAPGHSLHRLRAPLPLPPICASDFQLYAPTYGPRWAICVDELDKLRVGPSKTIHVDSAPLYPSLSHRIQRRLRGTRDQTFRRLQSGVLPPEGKRRPRVQIE